jgi:DNA-binding transcriptional LysR family regulator
MDLFSLRCFVEVVRTGGFSKAAERLGRTQPAVSAQIKNLEELAGGALFDRSVARPTLTRKGANLLSRAERLVSDFDAFVQLMGEVDEPEGLVTIAAGQTIIDHLLPEALESFQRAHRGIIFRLLNRNFSGLDRALSTGEADLAMGWFQALPDRWDSAVLKNFRFLLVARREPGPRSRDSVLAGPLVTFEQGSGTRAWLESHLGTLASVLELTSTESILRYVERGFGAALVPDYSVSPARRQGLDWWSLAPQLPDLDLRLVWRKGASLSPAAQLVGDWAQRAFS